MLQILDLIKSKIRVKYEGAFGLDLSCGDELCGDKLLFTKVVASF